MKVKKQQFRTGHATTDWFRLGKEYVKAVYLFIAYLASMQYIIQKAREFQENIYFCFIDYTKAFGCGSQLIVENS